MPVEVTEQYIRIRQNDPTKYVRLRTITISAAKGIRAIVGFKKGSGSEVQAYLFDKKRWTIASARKWIAAHKGDSLSDAILIEKLQHIVDTEWTTAYINSLPDSSFAAIEPAYLKGETTNKGARHLPFKGKNGKIDLPHLRNALARMGQIKPITKSISIAALRAKARKVLLKHAKQLKSSKLADDILIEKLRSIDLQKQMSVFLADSVMVDAWTETPEGITFHNVVFAKEGVQKYPDGMHYKPASELRAALDSFRGKPVVAFTHPPEKVVTNLKQQIGYIVFDSVKWDTKNNRPYGDVFVKKEKRTKEIIEALKKKKLRDNSIGFRCDIVNQPGVFNGIHYDKVQKNFFIDHLALVYRGRTTSEEGVGINAY